MTCWKVFGESQLTFLLPNLHGLIARVLHTMGHWEAVAAFVFDFSAQIMLHHLAWLEEMDICLCWNSLHFVYLKWASSEQAFALNQFPGTNRAQLCAPVLPWNAHSWVYGVVYLYRCIFEHLYICVFVVCAFVYLCISMSTVSKLARMNGFPGNMACARPVLPQNNAPLGFQWILWMRWCSNVCHCCKQNQILTHSSVSIQLNNNNNIPCK